MRLSPGMRLGPYEVVEPIGAGGMGEVYQARDTRLDRVVAMKVLPEHLSSDPARRQRFEREARVVSALSHPHICALHDIGHQDEIDYLVMEYVEGETLARRLQTGALPVDQAVRCAIEIAEALAWAHQRGVVHRDLKPGNIMLTKSGVKLLDFGLAKVHAPPTVSASDLSELPTEALTREGTLVGTLEYMAPEQLEGKEIDARTDIWALGAVLYEMVMGRRAFEGKSLPSLIAAILHQEPGPVTGLQPLAPSALDHVVRTCLAKDPDERWQDARDVVRELSWIAQGRSGPAVTVGAARRIRGARLAWAFAALGAVATVALATWLTQRPSQRLPVLHLSLLPPDGASFDPLAGPMALSPDGRQIAFVARRREGTDLLWVRPLDSPTAQPLAGTEGASYPFWSPDGRFLAFFSVRSLYAIAAAGGVREKLVDSGLNRGGTWSRDGVVLVSDFDGPIRRFSLSDRAVAPATTLDQARGETSHLWPHFLPDGRRFLYLVQRVDPASRRAEREIWVQSLDSRDRTRLRRADSNAIYVPPGYLIFWWEGDLLAQPFDPEKLRLTDDPFLVARKVQRAVERLAGLFSASATGVLTYLEGGDVGLSQLVVLDRSGKTLEPIGTPGDYWEPQLSNDGRRVAVAMTDPLNQNRDIWLFHLSQPQAPLRFTLDRAEEATPVWSPDDRRIAFSSFRNGASSILEKTAAGAGSGNALSPPFPGKAYLTDWSPDGEFIAYNRRASEDGTFAVVLLSARDRKTVVLVEATADVRDAAFSPDGRWVAYMSRDSGREEIYVRAFRGDAGRWQASASGGRQPRWRSDGKELFYLAPDGTLMAVAVRSGSTFEAGVPRPLFVARMRPTTIAQYDVFPGGRRFLVNVLVGDDPPGAMTLVQNWMETRTRP